MTMLATFHLVGRKRFTVTFEDETRGGLMSQWGDLINDLKTIDPSVSSVCYPIKERRDPPVDR